MFFIGLVGSGTWLKRNRKAALLAIGGIGGAAIVITAVAGQDNPSKSQPTPVETVVRVDLLSSRDLDTTAPFGLPAGGVDNNKPTIADQTWTRSGGQLCYPTDQSHTAARCFATTEVSYSTDATGLHWLIEPDVYNGVPQSTAINATNWTVRGTGAATALQPDPSGGTGASTVAVSTYGNDVFKSAAGFGPSATIYPRVWIKCSSGTFTLQNSAGAGIGQWNIDCATASGGSWMLIRSATQTGVTEVSAWVSTAGGVANFHMYGAGGSVTATVWAPTLAKTEGHGLAVVPTAASAVTVTAPSWTIDNTDGKYYRTGDDVVITTARVGSTKCWWVNNGSLRLSGASGNPCTGKIYAIQVSRVAQIPKILLSVNGSNAYTVRTDALRWDVTRIIDVGLLLDLWAPYAQYKQTKGGASEYGDATPITAVSSVWDLTIYDATDFVGGGHGRQTATSTVLYIDGVAKSLAAAQQYVGSTVRMTQTSEIYRKLDNAKIVDVSTAHTWTTDGNMTLDATLTWVLDHPTIYVYIGMYPIIRTAGTQQISGTAIFYPSGISYDVSSAGHATGAKNNQTAVRIFETGATDTTVTWSNVTGTSPMWLLVSDSVTYNKVYQNFTTTGASALDTWTVTTTYTWTGGSPW